MQLSEALGLAAMIDAAEGVELLAVGRFVDPADVAGKPWGCSVLCGDKRVVIWNLAAWDELLRSKRKAVSRAAAPAPANSLGIPEEQLTLF